MQPYSFMKQLVDSKTISNHVVAINARDSTDPLNGSDTVVKFGGWDKNMTKDGTLLILETVPSSVDSKV